MYENHIANERPKAKYFLSIAIRTRRSRKELLYFGPSCHVKVSNNDVPLLMAVAVLAVKQVFVLATNTVE